MSPCVGLLGCLIHDFSVISGWSVGLTRVFQDLNFSSAARNFGLEIWSVCQDGVNNSITKIFRLQRGFWSWIDTLLARSFTHFYRPVSRSVCT